MHDRARDVGAHPFIIVRHIVRISLQETQCSAPVVVAPGFCFGYLCIRLELPIQSGRVVSAGNKHGRMNWALVRACLEARRLHRSMFCEPDNRSPARVGVLYLSVNLLEHALLQICASLLRQGVCVYGLDQLGQLLGLVVCPLSLF